MHASALLLLLAASFTLAQQAPARPSVLLPDVTCNGVLVRKEVRDLSQGEWSRYVAAVKQIQANGIYDRIVKLHLDFQTSIHNYPSFLPWHRYYVRQFEMHLQRVDPSVTVPYWNWAFDAQAPETSDVLSAKYFGGNGRGAKNCVADGAFSTWRPYYPRGRHCMRRQFDLDGDAISSFYGPEVINTATNDNPTYDAFRQALEYPIHGAVHTNIGSDFSSMASPNDPLFFSHHAFIDKIWTDWQRVKNGLRAYGGTNQDGTPATRNDKLLPWSTTIGRVLDGTRLCYRYQDMKQGHQAGSRTPPTAADPVGQDDTDALAGAQPGAQTGTRPGAQTGTQPGTQAGGAGDWWRRRLIRRAAHETRDGGDNDLSMDEGSDMDTTPSSRPSKQATLVRKPTNYVDVEPSNVDEPADAPMPPPSTARPAVYTAPPPKADSAAVYNVSYADRTNLLAIRVPKPIPEWWANMNRIPLDRLRQREQKFAKVCVEINKIPEYVSPCAIFNRDHAIAKLSKKVKTFYAVVNGTKVIHAPSAYQAPSNGRQGGNDRTRQPNLEQTVRHVRDTVKSNGGDYLDNAAQRASRFGDRLRRVIGVVVQPVLKTAYPVLAHHEDAYAGDDEDDWCDADYDDATGTEPIFTGKQPVSGDLFKTPFGGSRPTTNHGGRKIQLPIALPSRTAYVPPAGYKKRVPSPNKQLNDGGDNYDAL